MYRKILTFFVLFIFLTNISFADEIDTEEINLNLLETSGDTLEISPLYSKYAIVLERTTLSVLFEKDGYSKTPMASTTKIMTAIVAIENSKLTDIVQISPKAASTGGSTLGINKNSKLTMETLLYGLLMRSGNDCAVAIAEHISGNVSEFANLMNEKAKSLNLNNTHFVTPHGLDATEHYTTAYDLALLTDYALKNETFSKIVKTQNTTISMDGYSKSINNTHELLGYLDGVYGVKTGFTGNAGRCLVTACKRNNLDIIIVILGADTKKIRTTDTINLINYVYNNFEMLDTSKILKNNFNLNNYSIQNGSVPAELYLEAKNNYIYPVLKRENDFQTKIYILNNIKAPIQADTKIGTIKFYANNVFLYENDILVKESVSSTSFTQYLFFIIKKLKNQFNYNI